jgi:hypothetical protein
MADRSYILEFSKKHGGGGQARLICSALDKVLHPSGTTHVTFEGRTSLLGVSEEFVIESFHLESLAAYLGNQEFVRGIVERELAEARASWLGKEGAAHEDIWSDTKLHSLWLPCMEHNLADSGTSETRTMFIVEFAVDWDPEHVNRTAKFRNGQFVSLGVDGD